MAEGILYGIIQTILENLGSEAMQEIGVARDVKKELPRLKTILHRIKNVLQDAKEQQMKKKEVKEWLADLKDVVYQAQDILDEYATDALLQKAEASRANQELSLIFPIERGSRLREIRERLDEIASDMSKFNFSDAVVHILTENREREQTHSFVRSSKVIGREKEKEEIIQLLLGSGDEVHEKVPLVIPIVGIGGIGKTTFSQLVYNDERIENHFKRRMWVWVSEDFDPKTLVERILKSATNDECRNLEMDQLQIRLREILKKDRFLLVLDDVGNEHREKWERLRDLLENGGAMGSKIMVTTRCKMVASIMSSHSPFNLEKLKEDDCWNLFKQQAFNEGEEERYPILVEIGRKIMKKCGGLPLAAKTIGGLLFFKRTEPDWQNVLDSEIWELPEEDEHGYGNQ